MDPKAKKREYFKQYYADPKNKQLVSMRHTSARYKKLGTMPGPNARLTLYCQANNLDVGDVIERGLTTVLKEKQKQPLNEEEPQSDE